MCSKVTIFLNELGLVRIKHVKKSVILCHHTRSNLLCLHFLSESCTKFQAVPVALTVPLRQFSEVCCSYKSMGGKQENQ